MPLLNQKTPLLPGRIANRILPVICGLILCAIFIAGLSPFTPHPRNEVRWLENQNGLRFGGYAAILSSAPFRLEGEPDGPCSIELWMQPGLIQDSNTMLAFDSPEKSGGFTMNQSLDDLALERKPTKRN